MKCPNKEKKFKQVAWSTEIIFDILKKSIRGDWNNTNDIKKKKLNKCKHIVEYFFIEFEDKILPNSIKKLCLFAIIFLENYTEYLARLKNILMTDSFPR